MFYNNKYIHKQSEVSNYCQYIVATLRLASFYGTSTNSTEPDQTPQNAASGQVLLCLQTEVSFKI